MHKYLLVFAFIIHFSFNELSAQVVINEFMASNTGIITDPDYNESSDWIELYNSGTTAVDLGGYYLTDNFGNLTKWRFPTGTLIEANGYLVIWADGLDTGLHANFKLSASGEEIGLFDRDAALVDTISYTIQDVNISMGRTPDGASTWQLFIQPTPSYANSTASFSGLVKNKPMFSPLGGMFQKAVAVEISTTFGGEIRYTLDGTEPTSQSLQISGPLLLSETTTLRARIFKPEMIPGEVITHTYFIDPTNELGELPVVAISTDPYNFWDTDSGIYVQNFKPGWEVPINIELFENDGSDRAAFNLKAGTKVNGLYSWKLPQKMLGIYFRKDYGKGKLDYTLFSDRARNQFDSYALRASGSDWSYTLIRDAFSQHLTKLNTTIEMQGYKPCAVYVNSAYLGIHNMRSKIDEDFVIRNNNLPSGSIDMVENEDYAEAGSLTQYVNFKTLYQTNLTINANYEAVKTQMDIENFTDLMITEIYVRNTSLDHNVMAWKPKDGGKWRWILMDLDRGFFNPESSTINFFINEGATPFRALMTNPEYKHYFGLRLADQFFTTFNTDRVSRIIDEFKSGIASEIPKHIDRWQGTTSSYGNAMASVDYWEGEIEKLKSFASVRPTAILADLMNYGFEASSPLSVSLIPSHAGTITFNELLIDQSPNNGYYPLNESITLEASNKVGYDFIGWMKPELFSLVNTEEVWKYYDAGDDLDTAWYNLTYNDASWKTGQAELGYGDDDENTIVNYTGNAANKNITTYFRKTVSITDPDLIQALQVNLKCDDGAVVYLNGTELLRYNMPDIEITVNTTSTTSIGGSAEDDFITYMLPPDLLVSGDNCIAAEVHQSDVSSSDISFDLSLNSYQPEGGSYYSTANKITFTQTGNLNFIAVFEPNGQCLLPSEISDSLTLTKACSPYAVPENVLIHNGAKVIIEPGVTLLMEDDVTITVNGSIQANGTADEPIFFNSNPESENKQWGSLRFEDADSSLLRHVIIENASFGSYSARELAAISVFNSTIALDYLTLENNYANPIAARYSDIRLTNSTIHSDITGDLINVKYGKGYVANTEFRGNDKPDTDAIDFDDVTGGIIRNCVIHDFYGSNSDGIDIGEQCVDILIDSVFIHNITDKGISVGQQSSVRISESVFANCTMGAGLKDSSRVSIDHCTYYGVNTAVASYEKNRGDAGANVWVTNSILSNTYDQTILVDEFSTLDISYSASDNDTLPDNTNYFLNPLFTNPGVLDLSLAANSPCIDKGEVGNMGSGISTSVEFKQPFISRILYNTLIDSEELEYVVVNNPGLESLDISGYKFTKGVTFTFPENTVIDDTGKVIITNNASLSFWNGWSTPVYQWESGKLANEGEAIRFVSSTGIVVDQVKYTSLNPWPILTANEGIVVKALNVDNHFGENWTSFAINDWVGINRQPAHNQFSLFPNPTNGQITIKGLKGEELVEVFSITGIKVMVRSVNSINNQLDMSGLSPGVYLIRMGAGQQKVLLMD